MKRFAAILFALSSTAVLAHPSHDFGDEPPAAPAPTPAAEAKKAPSAPPAPSDAEPEKSKE